MGDAVWEAEGVLPLAAMLGSKEPQEFDAAASAVAELANPDNKAFQVSAVWLALLRCGRLAQASFGQAMALRAAQTHTPFV